jgi:Fe-S oxidoreductase
VLKNEYPRFGGEFEVVHHAELIARLLRERRLALRPNGLPPTALHDACYLGRYHRIFDAPREVVRAVAAAQLVELPRRREESFCCGGGGANYWYDVPQREPAGNIRMREARKAGASVVAAECPFCIKTHGSLILSTGSENWDKLSE